jgi:serine/threonine protein phosphatase PrpC
VAAVADGLGSGEDAARASRLAMATVGEYAWAELPEMLQWCHLALRGTRGAVMSVLKIDKDRVSYAGVGNVGFCGLSAADFRPINAYGIVGSRFPSVRAFEGVYAPGDMFVLSTDGITREFSLDKLPAVRGRPPQALAEQIAERFSRQEDDVTVVVVA